jgi:hypothetical protein
VGGGGEKACKQSYEEDVVESEELHAHGGAGVVQLDSHSWVGNGIGSGRWAEYDTKACKDVQLIAIEDDDDMREVT